ncbi:hypothetical protein ASPWEDRAFT_55318 [Aspergillus wentii DTO 134E9]|uniref:Protein kinase domain-containing protein n=1 Tax=Aspergillus wentii DTO 134E9 TaxID=1073089 RepID=A0A1L9R480_ASPWE|nr:uncharacterized protein ASPWEDRAFT_55318 [Aspergillus wentii DTO 134E9]OJJ29729.1 hypothetical protein ASPWEDRAFT_55318 [Aspergillus wentii DTO 134E9]
MSNIDIKSSEVEFLRRLKQSQNSVVFKVRFQEKICAMKVYHDRGPFEHDPHYCEVNLFISESTAYHRLKSKGLCRKGIIPNFYGTIRNIQPAFWPDLDILDEIHTANVYHADAKPRNMMIDFDSAQIFSEGGRSARQERWIKQEVEMVGYFVDALDYEGRVNRTFSYYYEYM